MPSVTASPPEEILRFSTADCSLGVVLVAMSAAGICSIILGDGATGLPQILQARFPHARLIQAGTEGAEWLVKILRRIENPTLPSDLPLDVRGTGFQKRVWSALCEIPSGTTLSYAQVAAKIGCPKAVRAIAGACAANHIAVIIPCHRVIRSDGKLSGYRWGAERKRALLEREAR
jgi:AraC family transcriptional regulator, regulatory protein of adaptative response / methylated-DNA-[protein]-cysteine methyltransferase